MSKLNDKLFMTNAELQTAIDHLSYFIGAMKTIGEVSRWENHLERLLEIQRERAALMHCASNEELSDTERFNSAIGELMYHKCNPFLTTDLMTKTVKSVFNKEELSDAYWKTAKEKSND
jgi:hypothetical protein